jgi:putative DNA primase/helicase
VTESYDHLGGNGSAATGPEEKPRTIQGDLRNLPSALAPLVALPRWVLWQWEKNKKGKWTKVPYQPNGRKAESDNRATWNSYDAALAAVDRFDGIGFMMADHGAFDIDDCRDPDTGAIHPFATELIAKAGSYVEITVSGTGLRIVGTAAGEELHRNQPVVDGVSLETYRRTNRYIVVTGNPLEGSPPAMANIDAIAEATVAELDAKKAKGKSGKKSNKGSSTASASAGGSSNALPAMLETLLCVPNLGEGVPHGGYASRSELFFAFVTGALGARVAETVIIDACLDEARAGCAIFEHCQENGGRAYVERQIERAKIQVREARSEMMTDLGNARALVRLHGSDLRYVHAWSSWLAWDGGHWQRDDNEAVVRKAKATVEEIFVEAARVSDEALRTSLRKHAIASQNAQRLAAMVKLAESEMETVLAVEKIDADPLLLGVRNGVVDLRTGQFRPTQREDYVTKRAGVAFDPSIGCPRWIAFLDKIFAKDHALIEYIQRATGYVLTGLTDEEVLFVLWGDGDNGKSTFRETIFALLGDYAVGADASMLITTKNVGGATPDLARLYGRRLLTVNETQQSDFLNEARVKFITSHDVITARNLYEAPFDFTPTHKTFLTTNYKPIVKGTDVGIWRRLHLVPFLTTIAPDDRDPRFRQKMLMPELSGILNWAIAGLKSYNRVGLNAPQAVTSATDEYRHDMNLVGLWIEERCALDPGSEVKTVELHLDYKAWAEKQVGFAMSTIAFARELSNQGFKPTKVDRSRGFRGLKLQPAM